jgi:excisionase family DNA binding protein
MDSEKEFLTANEMADKLGLQVTTFKRLVATGVLPHAMPITGGKLKLYKRSEIAGMLWLIDLRAMNRLRKSTPNEIEADAEDEL